MAIVQDRLCGVYLIRCAKKLYVGSSIDIHTRWKQHRHALIRGDHRNIYLQRAWGKYGESAFEFEIIELCFSEVRADRENYWLHKLKAANPKYGYNLATNALVPDHGTEWRTKMSALLKGRIMPPEWRARISEAARNRPPRTPEQRAHQSAVLKGRTVPPEIRRKISEGKKGKKNSPEHCAHMSAARKGVRMPLHIAIKHHKLTMEQAHEIRQLAATGLSYLSLSKKFAVSDKTIASIVKRKTYLEEDVD